MKPTANEVRAMCKEVAKFVGKSQRGIFRADLALFVIAAALSSLDDWQVKGVLSEALRRKVLGGTADTTADLEAARIATAEAEAGIGVLVARVKELEDALKFYADTYWWEHDTDGNHKFTNGGRQTTAIEADRGGAARKAPGGDS